MKNIRQQNIDILSKYEPKKVLEYFANLCSIPHGSGNEKQISEYIASVLKPHCKEVIVYPDGTVYAFKEATPGYENRKITCLQAHEDMVCVKRENSNFDFFKDPLEIQVNDGWINAKDTSLGADDCIGVAYILDVFTNDKIVHGPIEALITASEESNMHGVNYFPNNVLKAKYLINLDHEETSSFCVGCQGGIEFNIINKFKREDIDGLTSQMSIAIKDGVTGHSGNMIKNKIVNANKTIFELLTIVRSKYKFSMVEVNGGTAKNVIPGFCVAKIAINEKDYDGIKQIIEEQFAGIKKEYYEREKKLRLIIEKETLVQKPINQEFSDKMLHVFNAVFNGVYALSEDYGISEGSSSWGILKTQENEFISTFLLRTLFASRKIRILNRITSAFYGTNYEFQKTDEYPEWTPITSNNFLQDKFIEIYKKMIGKEPTVYVIEGGLESGVLIKKYPHLVALAMGPQIYGAHSFEEKTSIEQVGISYNILLELLKQID